ncbi:MAG TPA: class I SAM-dependent methyltransferase [Bryobacteraceae bacterium]|nr:class I SAM-dependent methyltransferase [Bryobacteraceae bacterium]
MAPQITPENAPNPALVFEVLQSYQRTSALKAAIDLDLFRAVGETGGDLASIAKQCSASERGTRILCDYLTISGLLTKDNGRYALTPTSATFLDTRSPASLASVAAFLANPMLVDTFKELATIVRTGRTVLPGDGSVEPENPAWVQFAESMAPMMGPVAGPMAELALDGKSGPVRVLDIAAGHGLFGIAVAQQNPQARIVALDWAAVLQVAKRNAEKAGVQDRYELLPGSAFDVPYGGPYDAVLLTNFLHHFDHPANVSLLKKVHTALKPGGVAATLEFVPNDDRVSPPQSASFALTMLGSTVSGDAYTLKELTAMYEEAGFHNVTGHPIPMSPQTVVLGRA